MATGNSSTRPPIPWRVYGATALLGVVVVATLGYSTYVGTRMSRVYAPLVEAAVETKLELASAHLWLEEVLSGDTTESMDTVRWHLGKAAQYANGLQNGGVGPHGRLWGAEDSDLRAVTAHLLGEIIEFDSAMNQRSRTDMGSAAGTVLDERFDSLFRHMLADADEVEERVGVIIDGRMALFHSIQLALIALCLLTGVAVALTVVRFERRRSADLSAIRALNQQLDASVQQLGASNQQLRAQQQQLEAQEQQLRAANQQLQAGEQQLSAGNEQLKRERDRAQQYLDLAGTIFVVIDSRGEVTLINRKGCEVLGYEEAEILGKNWFEHFIPPRIRDEILPVSHKLLSGEIEPAEYYENPVLAKDGGERLIAWHNTVIRNDQGSVIGHLSSGTDITEKKAFEEALRRSENNYRTIFDAVQDMILVHDAKTGAVIDVNHRAVEHFEFSKEEFRGLSAGDFSAGKGEFTQEEASAKIGKAFSEGPQLYEWLCRRKGGSLFWVEVNLRRALIGEDEVALAVVRNIDERKKLTDELAKTQRLESLGLLAGGIAHDFNNLLGGLFGYIDMAMSYGNPNREVADYLDKALGAYHRAKDLTRQLLTFSKGGIPVTKPVDPVRLVREATGLALSGSPVRGVFEVGKDVWTVEVDEGQISQVVNNVVMNARQAMPDGGTVHVAADNVVVGSEESLPVEPGKFVAISIRDKGVGISPDHIAKIFDPFFTTKQIGSGLGLATCYSILQKHGGHIGVKSELGAGTEFTIYLPASGGEADQSERDDGASVGGSGRVLLMDDEAVVREMAAEMLRKTGYHVVTAEHGEEAISLYKESLEEGRRFDAVILDLTVADGMGGEKTAKQLREIDPEVAAIVSSGYADSPVLARCGDYGFVAAVPKPYRMRELGKVLKHVLGGRERT